MAARSEKITFPGSQGFPLAARLDMPQGNPAATALFAHCFTCSKDIFAASRISGGLTDRGFAVLRFDFTGLGMSGGEFANTNFSSNVQDLIAAASYLREKAMPADILIGHSLGGTAVLAAAAELPEVKAVATVAAPSDAAHIVRSFAAHIGDIKTKGEAAVTLAGRNFTIKKQFLDDVEGASAVAKVGAMRKALLIFHSPADTVVGLDNASAIFTAAKHPKSFVSLDKADHLLSNREDAVYVAAVLSAWASRYVMGTAAEALSDLAAADGGAVTVTSTGRGFQQKVRVGDHCLLADEPFGAGGDDTGPSPYDYLAIALGACTSMTLRLYADLKKLPLGRVRVQVRRAKTHIEDCKECAEGKTGRLDSFVREIALDGDLTPEDRAKLMAIADRCPVHQTLEKGSTVSTAAVPFERVV